MQAENWYQSQRDAVRAWFGPKTACLGCFLFEFFGKNKPLTKLNIKLKNISLHAKWAPSCLEYPSPDRLKMSPPQTIPPSLFMDIVNTINQATTLDHLFTSTMEVAPVTMASYHHFPSVGAFDYKTLGTFRSYNLPPFVEEYYRNYSREKADSVIEAAFAKGGFIWLTDLPDNPIVMNAKHSKTVRAGNEQLGEGLCIPLFGPNNRRGFMVLVGDSIRKENGAHIPYQVQALALLFHSRFCLIIQDIQRQINLTSREAEVVELLTYGKTNKEIADALNITASTVSGYMKAIFIKLEVSDRVSASMRAQSMSVVF